MGIANLLGNHTVIGGLFTVLAGVAFLAWDYIRIEQSGQWLARALTVRWIAVALTVMALIFMGSRFVSVVASYGGV